LIRALDGVLQRKRIAEDAVGQVKVERSGVSCGGRPGNVNRAGRVDLGGRLVELQGRDDGEGEKECAELSEHGESCP